MSTHKLSGYLQPCPKWAENQRDTPEFGYIFLSAISTTLASSMARVIGPTPPGFGEYAETLS